MSNEKNCGFCGFCADKRFFCSYWGRSVSHETGCAAFCHKVGDKSNTVPKQISDDVAYLYVMPFVSDKGHVVFVERMTEKYFDFACFRVVNVRTGDFFTTESWTNAVSLALYGFDDDVNGVFDFVLRIEDMELALLAMRRYYKQETKVILDLEYSQDFMEQ